MDVGSTFSPVSLIPAMCVLAAGVAFLVAFMSYSQALAKSHGYPAFDALGFRKWAMGVRVFGYMPPAAQPYVKRFYLAFAAFMLVIVCLAVFAILTSAPAP